MSYYNEDIDRTTSRLTDMHKDGQTGRRTQTYKQTITNRYINGQTHGLTQTDG